jgi:ligand-binding SRPBCC domain-containing protein
VEHRLMQHFRDTVIVDAPITEVFQFYTDVENLPRMMPPDLKMRVVKAHVPLVKGSRVQFAVGLQGVPFEMKWEAEIIEYEPNRFFSDKLLSGPFEYWVHHHEFHELDGGKTEICDTIDVGAPLGLLGRLVENLFINSKIREMFDHRRGILRERFPSASASH